MAEDPRACLKSGESSKWFRGATGDSIAVVIGHDGDRFVLIADGDVRRAEKPEEEECAACSQARRTLQRKWLRRFAHEGKVTNATLRYALRQFLQTAAPVVGEDIEEGSVPNGEG